MLTWLWDGALEGSLDSVEALDRCDVVGPVQPGVELVIPDHWTSPREGLAVEHVGILLLEADRITKGAVRKVHESIVEVDRALRVLSDMEKTRTSVLLLFQPSFVARARVRWQP